MSLDTLKFTVTSSLNWTATKNVAGQASGNTNTNAPNKSTTYQASTANNLVGGADEMYSLLLSIPASSSTTIDLTNFQDILSQAAVSLARLKFGQIRLLGATESAPDGTAGTACSGITVGNAATNPFSFNLVTPTETFTVDNAGRWEYAGGGASGFTVDGTHKSVKIANNDGANAAKVYLTFVGGTT